MLEKIINEIDNAIPNLFGVYLFGSRARSMENSESDWDLAFLADSIVTSKEIWGVKTGIEAKLDIDIDLIDLNTDNLVLRAQVLRDGRLVLAKNKAKLEEFEYLTLSFYQKLNEERAEILKDIKRSGKIFK